MKIKNSKGRVVGELTSFRTMPVPGEIIPIGTYLFHVDEVGSNIIQVSPMPPSCPRRPTQLTIVEIYEEEMAV